MIKTYEGFIDFLKSPKGPAFAEELTNFFKTSVSDIKFILCEITDEFNTDSDFEFRMNIDSNHYRLDIENDKFILPKSDLNFCGFNNMYEFIQRISEYRKSKFTFDIEFKKATDTDKQGYYVPTFMQNLSQEDPGKLPEHEMKTINDAGERIKEICGFKTYKLEKRSSALNPITLWIMKFSF